MTSHRRKDVVWICYSCAGDLEIEHLTSGVITGARCYVCDVPCEPNDGFHTWLGPLLWAKWGIKECKGCGVVLNASDVMEGDICRYCLKPAGYQKSSEK